MSDKFKVYQTFVIVLSTILGILFFVGMIAKPTSTFYLKPSYPQKADYEFLKECAIEYADTLTISEKNKDKIVSSSFRFETNSQDKSTKFIVDLSSDNCRVTAYFNCTNYSTSNFDNQSLDVDYNIDKESVTFKGEPLVETIFMRIIMSLMLSIMFSVSLGFLLYIAPLKRFFKKGKIIEVTDNSDESN